MEISSDAVNPVFEDMLGQLTKTLESLPRTQERMLGITGVAWSADRMVRVVVGARGQLVDLEIDPRVFRRPDVAQLRAEILSTSAAAVQQAAEQVKELMEQQFPPEFAELRNQMRPDASGEIGNMFRSDAEIHAEREEQS